MSATAPDQPSQPAQTSAEPAFNQLTTAALLRQLWATPESAGLLTETAIAGGASSTAGAGNAGGAGTPASGAIRLTQALTRGVLDLLYPPQCPLTGRNLADQPNPWLAREVLDALPVLEQPLCPRCGGPQESPARNAVAQPRCRRCLQCEGRFERSVCLWEYESAGRDLVLCFKFGAQRHLATLLGRWLYGVARARDLFDGVRWLVPAPGSQTVAALAADENHALQLARAVAEADAAAAQPLGLRVLPGALTKIRHTTPQATLPLTRRLTEPAGSMSCLAGTAVQNECLVLIDDVLTTLATASEAARALTAAGAREVRLLALARTL